MSIVFLPGFTDKIPISLSLSESSELIFHTNHYYYIEKPECLCDCLNDPAKHMNRYGSFSSKFRKLLYPFRWSMAKPSSEKWPLEKNILPPKICKTHNSVPKKTILSIISNLKYLTTILIITSGYAPRGLFVFVIQWLNKYIPAKYMTAVIGGIVTYSQRYSTGNSRFYNLLHWLLNKQMLDNRP